MAERDSNTRAVQQLRDRFAGWAGAAPRIFQAPGRVNLIGEHTDYNGGFVMPAAVGFFTWVAASARPDRKLVVRSENFDDQVEMGLEQLAPRGNHHWSDYIAGVASALEGTGRRLAGADLMVYGNVPLGAGLSSSAALEVAVGSALLGVARLACDGKQLALACQQAENEFVGARCGIMDQFISCHGKRDHALLLDCRSLEYRLLPLPHSVRLVICNTMVRHSIAGGEYNERRSQCEEGVRRLAEPLPHVQSLRDVSEAEFAEASDGLPEMIRKRCRHVIGENARVLRAATALENGDLEEFGRLMRDSHESLRDDYEVSCRELDLMVGLAQGTVGVYGSRMTGGGFGGCTVNLVREEAVEGFVSKVGTGYEKATGVQPEIYVCYAADGARELA